LHAEVLGALMARRFDLRHLDAFLAVCETLHFGQAADQLRVSQPALSRTIQQLEAALGVALFDRNKRNVALSDAGRALRGHARKVVEQTKAAETRVRLAAEGRAGQLTIAYIDFAMMGIFPEILQKFRQAHPHVDIRLLRMPTDLQREVIQSGDVDVGFLLGKLTGPGLQSLLIEEQSLVALLPTHHPLANHDTIGIATLLKEPLVLGSLPEFSAFRRLVAEEAAKRHVELQVIQEASTSDGILALVAAGVGVSVYAQGASGIVRNGVVVTNVMGASSDADVYAAWNGAKLSSVGLRFISQLPGVSRDILKRGNPAKRSVA